MNYNLNLKPTAKIMNDIYFLSLLYYDLVLLIIIPCKIICLKTDFINCNFSPMA